MLKESPICVRHARRDCATLFRKLQEIAQELPSRLGQDGFGMELHAPDGMLAMLHGVNFSPVVCGIRRHLQVCRQRRMFDDEGVIAHDAQR